MKKKRKKKTSTGLVITALIAGCVAVAGLGKSTDDDHTAALPSSSAATTSPSTEETITYLTSEEMEALIASINATEAIPETRTAEPEQPSHQYNESVSPGVPVSTVPEPTLNDPPAEATPASIPSSIESSTPESSAAPSVAPAGNTNNFNTYNNPDQQNTTDNYVLNTNTMKIHYPDCSSVAKIAPQNYSTSNLDISELEAQGYSRCGICLK